MIIGGLQKLTLIDYPGKLAATVFCLGCNFQCPWCYSRELVLPKEIKRQPRISEKDFFAFLKERKGLLEGVVICGGEPCINKDLPGFCKKIKKLGYLVKIDTNGSEPAMLKKLIDKNLIDYIAMDIKAPLKIKTRLAGAMNNEYLKAAGVRIPLINIKQSIELIKNSEIDSEFRTTLAPLIHTKQDIVQIARDIFPAKKYYLQNFRPEKTIDPKFEKAKPYSDKKLLEIQRAVAPFFDVCQIR